MELFEAVPLKVQYHRESKSRWIEVYHVLPGTAPALPEVEVLRAEMIAHTRARLEESIPADLIEKKGRYDQMIHDIGQRHIDLQDRIDDLMEKRREAFLEASANGLATIDAEIVQARALLESNDSNRLEAVALAGRVQGEIEKSLTAQVPEIAGELFALTAEEEKAVADLRKLLSKNESIFLAVWRKMMISHLYSSRQGSWLPSLNSLATAAAAKAVAQPVEMATVPE
jgi:hypothetical protein